MVTKVGINGFGRIGRMVFKIGFEEKDIEFIAVNDLTPINNLAYLLKYDSVYGVYPKGVKIHKKNIKVGGKEIKIFSERDPAKLPWKKLGVDVVVESTGVFRHVDDARKHLKAGAKKVLVSAPTKGGGKTLVKGVNEHEYNKGKHDILNNASCTTNCVAPVVKVLNDNLKVKRGFLTTVHAYTSTQNLIDGPNKKIRRGRTAAWNLIPTTTGAAKAVSEVITELKGKFDGIALRVPIPCGSISDIVCAVEKETSVEKVNQLFKNVSEHHLKGVLEYSEEELVSSDILGNPHSAIVDANMTRVVNGNLVKVLAWYDNEWGFSARMVDLIKILV